MKTSNEIFRKHSEEANGEPIPQSVWDELKNENSDVGKIFRSAFSAMDEYAKQCLLEAVDRIEDQRSKNTIRQLLKELE